MQILAKKRKIQNQEIHRKHECKFLAISNVFSAKEFTFYCDDILYVFDRNLLRLLNSEFQIGKYTYLPLHLALELT